MAADVVNAGPRRRQRGHADDRIRPGRRERWWREGREDRHRREQRRHPRDRQHDPAGGRI